MACPLQLAGLPALPFAASEEHMSITSVSSTSSSDASWWLEAIKNQSSQQTQDTWQAMSTQGPPDIKLSPMGQMMSKLESLSTSDPDKFKQVTEDISEKLKAAASQATGTDADMLNKMADRFAEASKTGDMSALKPPKPADVEQGQSQSTGQMQGHHHYGPSEAVRIAMDDIFSDVSSSLLAS
jgi:hypothetical protein